jgi:hypothetical protein
VKKVDIVSFFDICNAAQNNEKSGQDGAIDVYGWSSYFRPLYGPFLQQDLVRSQSLFGCRAAAG